MALEEALDQQSGHLKKLDRAAVIELEFVRSLSTVLGEKHLQEWSLKELPSKTHAMAMEQSIAGLEKVCQSELYKFTSQGCQERLLCAKRWVVCLSEGTTPVLPNGASSWLQSVWARLPMFARHTLEEKSAASSRGSEEGPRARVVTGKEALEAKWPELQKRPIADVSLDDLDMFVALRFLLSKPTQAAVDKLKAEVLNHHRGSKKSRPASSVVARAADEGATAKKRKLSAAKAAAKAATDSLFG